MSSESVESHLLGLGFTSTSSTKDLYEGVIECAFGKVDIWLSVDQILIDYPKIFLKKKPRWLPELCSHLNQYNQLCCTDRTISSPDRRVPTKVIDHVLARGADLLEKLVTNGGLVEDEFILLWGNNPERVPLGFMSSSDTDGSFSWQLLNSKSKKWICIVPADLADGVSKWLGAVTKVSCPVLLEVSISGQLRASNESWPIRPLKNLISWLNQIDSSAAEQMVLRVKKLAVAVASGKSFNGSIFVLMHHEKGSLGILFAASGLLAWIPRGKRRNIQRGARQVERLLVSASVLDTTQCRMIDIKPESLLNRIMGSTDVSLAGQKIIVIGAGSVGSFLCSALVRSGGGSLGGSLLIIDHDDVGPENLGRSLYDARHLGMKKVDALVQMLRHSTIGAVVEARPATAPYDPEAYIADILIDATGDHGYSTWLSEMRAQGLVPPVLFTWIGGHGAAVGAYLQIDAEAPCLACLGIADGHSKWNVTVTHDGEAPGIEVGPCGESFMPYSVAAPMMASSLALAHLLDNAAGRVGPSFRSIAIDLKRGRSLCDTPPACDHTAAQ
ncbi:hypothetical protein LMG31884_45340 [Xanthomonas hydrangeae]|uniref:ThiF family adenylyltransferase n=1 Tax=Xanthomonas hydrangeae TaxID=2775159 RepID=UPI0019653035|nr:hypothetical protein LMG31884_45340 [Xanthomonas hydrangeae]CAD7730807.1 hypothetical protein LMG31884_45340 [Xanthomonas hydrangeae]CAD7745859.1 hypothetical protein LMG31887_45260 [Xanthomonas hydrangeae]CAD7745862.1 hypothetical protein LMG31887_45260 [Xanthomonas hydrangeae]